MDTDKHGCKPANFRKVVDCGSPLPLFTMERPTQSARGLAQSKTLTRFIRVHPFSSVVENS